MLLKLRSKWIWGLFDLWWVQQHYIWSILHALCMGLGFGGSVAFVKSTSSLLLSMLAWVPHSMASMGWFIPSSMAMLGSRFSMGALVQMACRVCIDCCFSCHNEKLFKLAHCRTDMSRSIVAMRLTCTNGAFLAGCHAHAWVGACGMSCASATVVLCCLALTGPWLSISAIVSKNHIFMWYWGSLSRGADIYNTNCTYGLSVLHSFVIVIVINAICSIRAIMADHRSLHDCQRFISFHFFCCKWVKNNKSNT